MTAQKLRRPDSVEDACTQASALLGADAIATALAARGLRVSESLVAKWGDPEAPQTPSLEQALALEALLIKTGHAPIFAELFARLLPVAPEEASARPDPLRETMRAVKAATDLMDGVDRSMIDGRLDRVELNQIEKLTHAAQRQLARVRRVVRSALDLPKSR